MDLPIFQQADEQFNNMNILITGGAGFIGSHLAKHYIDHGDSVFIIDNLITGNKRNIASLNPSKLTFFESDVCTFDYNQLPKMDVIYHMASPASPIQYKKHPIETMMANSMGTKSVFDFAQKSASGNIVIASTSEVYGDPLEHPQKETYYGNVNSFGERSCYDEAKRFAEALARSYIEKFNLNIRIIRIFNTYGPNMEINDGRVISNFITQCITNKPITIYGDGSQTRSFCYVSDLVRGLIQMGEKEGLQSEIINVGNPNEKTVIELANMIKSMIQSTSEIQFFKTDKDDPKKRKPDITKAQSILGWNPEVTLEDGLTKTISYFKEALKTS